ncbi:MAG: hypothetical protein WCT04_05745 [Planctomycetota bacterium]
MKKFVVLFLIIGALVLGAFYLGWLTVNKDKIDSDMDKTKTKVGEIQKSGAETLGKAIEVSKENAAKAKEAAGEAIQKGTEAVKNATATVVEKSKDVVKDVTKPSTGEPVKETPKEEAK